MDGGCLSWVIVISAVDDEERSRRWRGIVLIPAGVSIARQLVYVLIIVKRDLPGKKRTGIACTDDRAV